MYINKKKMTIILIAVILFIAIVVFLGLKYGGKSEQISNYIVSFNTDGGSFLEAKLVSEKGKISKPEDPIKAGYILTGWYLNDKEYDFNTEITKNIVLVAKWETPPVPTYVVTFDSNGGSNVEAISVEENSKAIKPSNPSKSGLVFAGWQLDGKDYDFETPITTNITLKAVWETPDNRLTVKFNSNGGSSVSSQKVEPGAKATKPKNPSKSGYNFVEWQLNGSTYNFNTSVTSAITLKAVWEAKPITYTYSVKWEAVAGSVIGEYKMFIVRNDGVKVSGKIKVNYVEGGSDTFDVSTSGYQIVKAIVGSSSVVSPNS